MSEERLVAVKFEDGTVEKIPYASLLLEHQKILESARIKAGNYYRLAKLIGCKWSTFQKYQREVRSGKALLSTRLIEALEKFVDGGVP